jgi:hypothetical protein
MYKAEKGDGDGGRCLERVVVVSLYVARLSLAGTRFGRQRVWRRRIRNGVVWNLWMGKGLRTSDKEPPLQVKPRLSQRHMIAFDVDPKLFSAQNRELLAIHQPTSQPANKLVARPRRPHT